MDVDGASTVEPEVDVYLHLLVGVFLLDQKKTKQSADLFSNLVSRMASWNRRTLDVLSGKVYFYFARAHELQGLSAEIRPYVDLLDFNLNGLDSCCNYNEQRC